jgi:hypothetical protein
MAQSAEVQWFAILGAETGLFTLSQVRALAAKIGDSADVVAFA